MAEESKKPVKSRKSLMPDETTLVKTEKPKPMEVKAPAQMQTVPKPEEKAIQANPPKTEAPVAEVKAVKEIIKSPAPKTETAKTPETPKAETKAEVKKEADPAKDFVPVTGLVSISQALVVHPYAMQPAPR